MLGFTIPQLILFVFAFALYLVKPSWLILLWLISEPLLAPFIVIYSGAVDIEDQLSLVWGMWSVFNRLFILILLFEIIRGHKLTKSIKPILTPVIVLCIYFVLHNLVTVFSPVAIIHNWLFVFYSILPLLVFLLNKEIWPNLKAMFWVVLIVCIIQVVFIPLNLSGVFAYSGRYVELAKETTEASLVAGTFIRSNAMADYLAVVYLFITIDFFVKKNMSFLGFLIVSVIIIIPLLFAGSKMPIIVTIINLILCVLLFYQKKLVEISLMIVLSVIVIGLTVNVSIRFVGENEGLNRIVEFGNITKTKNHKGALDETTVGISTDLIERHFASSPIVGHGKASDNEDNAYSNSLSLDVPGLISDAALAFYLIEFGLVGLSLFLFFHYSVIKFSTFPFSIRVRKKVVILIFVFFVLFAVTERGLFNRTNLIFIYAYMFGLARINEEQGIIQKQMAKTNI